MKEYITDFMNSVIKTLADVLIPANQWKYHKLNNVNNNNNCSDNKIQKQNQNETNNQNTYNSNQSQQSVFVSKKKIAYKTYFCLFGCL